MKCFKISQTNQFGNEEGTRSEYIEKDKDQSDLDRTELNLKKKKRKKDMKISKNFKINVKTSSNSGRYCEQCGKTDSPQNKDRETCICGGRFKDNETSYDKYNN